MSEIDEMLVRIERAIEYYEKDTDDFGLPIFMRDIANTIILLKASEKAAGSLLLDLQQDCIKERQRAETAEELVKELDKRLDDYIKVKEDHYRQVKRAEHYKARAEAAEKRLAAGLAACGWFNAPPSDSDWIMGQATAAQQIHAALEDRT